MICLLIAQISANEIEFELSEPENENNVGFDDDQDEYLKPDLNSDDMNPGVNHKNIQVPEVAEVSKISGNQTSEVSATPHRDEEVAITSIKSTSPSTSKSLNFFFQA